MVKERNPELLDDAIQYTWRSRPNEWLKREILGLHPTTQNSKSPETQLKTSLVLCRSPSLSIKYQILPHPSKLVKSCKKWSLYLLPNSEKKEQPQSSIPRHRKKRKNHWPESNHFFLIPSWKQIDGVASIRLKSLFKALNLLIQPLTQSYKYPTTKAMYIGI